MECQEINFFKYRLYNKDYRKICDLKRYEGIIKKVYKIYEPDAVVKVEADYYSVMTEKPRIRTVMIGKELSSKKGLTQYGGFTKSGQFRLFMRYEHITMNESDLENIYHYFEGGKAEWTKSR